MLRATLLAALLAATAAAQTSGRTVRVNPDAPTTAYVNGRWYDADSAGVRFAPGDRYSIAGVFTATRPARVDTTVDLSGAYVVPPFGEAHNHSVDAPWTAPAAQRYLEQGVFYYKNPNDVATVTALGAGLFNTPASLDVVFAHGGLTVAGGHPEPLYRRLASDYGLDPDSLDGRAFFAMPTVDVLEQRWPDVLAGRPDVVKLYLLDAAGAGSEEPSGLSPEAFRRAVALAHEAGLRAVVHLETAADLALAIDAGADEAAHLPGYFWDWGLGADAYRISDDLARRVAARGLVVTTTTIVTEAVAQVNPEAARQKAAMQAMQVDNLRRLHAAGAALAIGTDIYSMTALDEVRHLRALGVFPDAELLRLWVETAPRSIFPGRAIGRLAAGFEASFLALACDPTADLGCAEQIRLRVKQGAVLRP